MDTSSPAVPAPSHKPVAICLILPRVDPSFFDGGHDLPMLPDRKHIAIIDGDLTHLAALTPWLQNLVFCLRHRRYQIANDNRFYWGKAGVHTVETTISARSDAA